MNAVFQAAFRTSLDGQIIWVCRNIRKKREIQRVGMSSTLGHQWEHVFRFSLLCSAKVCASLIHTENAKYVFFF